MEIVRNGLSLVSILYFVTCIVMFSINANLKEKSPRMLDIALVTCVIGVLLIAANIVFMVRLL